MVPADSPTRIYNRILVDALNPADASLCPTNTDGNIIQIDETGDAGKKTLNGIAGWDLDGQMPKSNWADYNCKVLIFSDSTTFSPDKSVRPRDSWGYLYIIPEQYGFGDFVKIIVQPPGTYYDVSPQLNQQTDDPFQMVKLYSSKRTNRFIIPDIYDVMIEFEPKSDDPGYTDEAQDATTKGTFKVSA